MKARRLLALTFLSIVLGCQGRDQLTGPPAPNDPSKIIRDGAHGGNKDFFFLPPMVPLPLGNPDFELGKFNNALRPSLSIEICELDLSLAAYHNAQGLPTDAAPCAAGKPLVKKFNPGSVQLVNLPLRQNGWWTLFNLPPDGFYYVLWDTRQSNLNVSKYYRIKVLLDGSSEPLGIADVDPMSSLFQWKYSNTGQVIQMIDDVLLPIPFRVEQGALCPAGSVTCSSATVSNDNPTGDVQVVQSPGDNGPIAGAIFPDGWLPAGGPQNVVVTITSFNTGINDVANGTQEHPCHAGLHLQQFNGCFTFSTIPALLPIADGHQFARPVTVVACFVLHDSPDAREPYAQLWSSGPNEPPHPLVSVSDALVLTAPTEHNCGNNFTIITSNPPQNPLVRFASAGWQTLKGGVGKLFGVKTAYAVDLGLGGLSLDFSNVGPAIDAHVVSGEFEPTFSVEPGSTTEIIGRIVGTTKHDGSPLSTGIGGFPLVFAKSPADAGGFRAAGSEAPLADTLTATTVSAPIFEGSLGSGGGFASVNWTAPDTPGTYTFTASSPVALGAVTYNVTVRPTLNFVRGTWVNENTATPGITHLDILVDGSFTGVQAFGSCFPTDCDWGVATANTDNWDAQHTMVAFWDQGFATRTMTIEYVSPNRLKVTTFSDYTPADGRTDFTMVEFFQRSP